MAKRYVQPGLFGDLAFFKKKKKIKTGGATYHTHRKSAAPLGIFSQTTRAWQDSRATKRRKAS